MTDEWWKKDPAPNADGGQWWQSDPVVKTVSAYGREWTPGEIQGYMKTMQNKAAEHAVEQEGMLPRLGRSLYNSLLAGWGPQVEAAAKSVVQDVPYDLALKDSSTKLKEAREQNPVASFATEAVGALAPMATGVGAIPSLSRIPAIGQAVSKLPTLPRLAAQGASASAPYGAVYGAGQANAEAPTVADTAKGAVEGAVTGAVVGGALTPAIAGTAIAAGRAKQALTDSGLMSYLTKGAPGAEEAAARAAERKMGMALEETGTPLSALAEQVAPAGRQRTALANADPEVRADIIESVRAGEKSSSIGSRLGLSPRVVSTYAKHNAGKVETPMGVVDLAKEAAVEAGRIGADAPAQRLMRTAAAIGGEGAEEAALMARLRGRQYAQQSRMISHVDNSVGGKTSEAAEAGIRNQLGQKADQAYAAARQDEHPFDLKPVYDKWIMQSFGTAGNIKKGLDRAIELFMDAGFSHIHNQGRFSDYLNRFHHARMELDHEISMSLNPAGKPTPLTKFLTQFRNDVNDVMRKANKKWAAADDLFSGAKSAENILEAGREMSLKLGEASREQLKFFDSLQPEQKALFRLGFARALKDRIANSRTESAAVAGQFNTQATRDIVNHIMPKEAASSLLKSIGREAITTETAAGAFRGSRTAPLGQDIQAFMNSAHLASDVARGNISGAMNRLGNQLALGIGQKQAGAVSRLATEFSPKEVVGAIRRMQKEVAEERLRRAMRIKPRTAPGVPATNFILEGDMERPTVERAPKPPYRTSAFEDIAPLKVASSGAFDDLIGAPSVARGPFDDLLSAA